MALLIWAPALNWVTLTFRARPSKEDVTSPLNESKDLDHKGTQCQKSKINVRLFPTFELHKALTRKKELLSGIVAQSESAFRFLKRWNILH